MTRIMFSILKYIHSSFFLLFNRRIGTGVKNVIQFSYPKIEVAGWTEMKNKLFCHTQYFLLI